MKISIITSHDAYNHGASLQAFALQHYLECCGNKVLIIDYKPEYLRRYYKFATIGNPKYNKPFIKYLYILAKLPIRLLSLRRKHAFDLFT